VVDAALVQSSEPTPTGTVPPTLPFTGAKFPGPNGGLLVFASALLLFGGFLVIGPRNGRDR
jgi:hypothetical protein